MLYTKEQTKRSTKSAQGCRGIGNRAQDCESRSEGCQYLCRKYYRNNARTASGIGCRAENTLRHPFLLCHLSSKPEETVGSYIYNLGNRQWDIPRLRLLLENILPQDTHFDDFEVEYDFPAIGHKIMMLNARQVNLNEIGRRMILIAIERYYGIKEAGAREKEYFSHVRP